MVCIYCASPTRVTNSRHQKKQNHIWRRRNCEVCGGVFTTHERPDLMTSVVVIKSGSNSTLTPFSRDQLFTQIYEACRHRTNATVEAGALTDTVIGHILTETSDGAVKAETIITNTLVVLRRFDPVAATIYAAYHQRT